MSAINIIDEMIEETLAKTRQWPVPVMGGARQTPFDGEVLGAFIRFAVLHEVRERITGERRNKKDLIAQFNERRQHG